MVLHSKPSLLLYGLLFSLWCFSTSVKYYFQVSFNLKVSLYLATQNAITELLSQIMSNFKLKIKDCV